MTACRFLLTFGLLAILGSPSTSRSEDAVDYSDLVTRMTDLTYPAVLPAVGETCKQWSSYDRASKYDETSGKYIRRDANGDGDGVIRTEGDQVVMAEMEVPVHDRHRLGGLFRLCLMQSELVRKVLPLPDDGPEEQRPPIGASLASDR